MDIQLDDIDKRILNTLQSDFPLVERPFAAIGEQMGVSEAAVLEKVAALKDSGIIRQTSAIFDSLSLGYKSILMAFEIPKERLEEAAECLNAHPGVSHNYEREHAFSLWCTLAVPPGSDLEVHIAALAEQTRALRHLPLPCLRRFKIGVNFKMGEDNAKEQNPEAKAKPSPPSPSDPASENPPPRTLSETERQAIRALQIDIPIESEPYKAVAAEFNMSVAELLDHGRRFLESGQMRRYASILRHRQAGYTHNVMSVWKVPPERAEEVGLKMAAFPEVSHCYERTAFEALPYSHYSMIHATSAQAAQKVVDGIKEATGLSDCLLLRTVREFKKVRVQYFTPEIGLWEAQHGITAQS